MKKYAFLLIYLCWAWVAQASPIWTIAIDPGHGGKDPGAISRNLGIYEKNVTLSIARELKVLLDKDPNFRGVLTRKGDYYISVPERSEIARRYKANFLISIHADSSESPLLRGASVWVLSNRRANDEMGQWLEDDEKRSELLGGAGKVLAQHNEKYLDQTVLDLQFGHSQRTGYELGKSILQHFSKIATLSRETPQPASLGVLRSPDIPSVLVETGFLSNAEEEKKLNTPAYRRRIAYMIYEGLLAYRHGNIKAESISDEKDSAVVVDSGVRHKVKAGESLGSLSNKYAVKVADIVTLNKLNRTALWVGESIKIPQNDKKAPSKKESSKKVDEMNTIAKRADEKGEKNSKAAAKNTRIEEKKEKEEKREKKGKEKKEKDDKNATQKSNVENPRQSNEKSKDKETNKKEKADKNNSEKDLPLYHKVEKDQTLYAVSRQYQIPVNKLLKLNPQLKDGKVLTGQKIKLKEK